jgi:hypothetical protein
MAKKTTRRTSKQKASTPAEAARDAGRRDTLRVIQNGVIGAAVLGGAGVFPARAV